MSDHSAGFASQLCFVVMAMNLWGVVGLRPSRAADSKLPEGVKRSLGNSASSLGPLTLEWERTRRSDYSDAELPHIMGSPTLSPAEYLAKKRVQLEYQDGKFHATFTQYGVMSLSPDLNNQRVPPNKRRPGESVQEFSFDGETFYNGAPRHRDPMISMDKISLIAERMPNLSLTQQDYLLNAGFKLPEYAAEFRDHQQPRSLQLDLIEQGATVERVGEESVDNAVVLAIELKTGEKRYRFDLDPAMNYATRRLQEWGKSGDLLRASRCSEFAKLSRSGLWLPKRVEIEWHSRPLLPKVVTKKTLVAETYVVTELSDKPIPDERFALKYEKPGTYISDGRLPGVEKLPDARVRYRQPANPDELDATISVAMAEGGGPRSRAPFWWSLLAVNTVLIVGAFGFFLWRRRALG
jgi:hypothetical protein